MLSSLFFVPFSTRYQLYVYHQINWLKMFDLYKLNRISIIQQVYNYMYEYCFCRWSLGYACTLCWWLL